MVLQSPARAERGGASSTQRDIQIKSHYRELPANKFYETGSEMCPCIPGKLPRIRLLSSVDGIRVLVYLRC